LNNKRKNTVDSEKHNPVFNWHHQNLNKSTVEMLIVLLQWLCSKVWESEFSQHCICHCVCSLVYIQAPKSGFDCLLWL